MFGLFGGEFRFELVLGALTGISTFLAICKYLKVWERIKSWRASISEKRLHVKVTVNASNINRIDKDLQVMSKEVSDLVANTSETNDIVKKVFAEVQLNGGHSLKDLVAREQNSRWFMHDVKGEAIWESIYNTTYKRMECVRASQSFLLVTGLTEDTVRSMGWLSALAEEYRPTVMAEWTSCLEQSRVFNMQYAFRHMDGTVKYVNGRFQPRTREGILVGGIGSLKVIPREEMRQKLIVQ